MGLNHAAIAQSLYRKAALVATAAVTANTYAVVAIIWRLDGSLTSIQLEPRDLFVGGSFCIRTYLATTIFVAMLGIWRIDLII